MSAKNPNTGSAHTILRGRDGTYVIVRGEGSVTRIYRLHVVKGNPPDNFVAEPDRARLVLENSVASVEPDALEFRIAPSAVGEYPWSARLRPFKDALER